jgi:hypothetical protein
MKRLTLAFALGLVTIAVTCLVAARQVTATAADKTPALATRAAVAFDMSPPLGSMAQFIPAKSVVIHHAVESPPERQGATEGPGSGLGTTPPTPTLPVPDTAHRMICRRSFFWKPTLPHRLRCRQVPGSRPTSLRRASQDDRGHVIAERAGHAMHAALVARFMSDPSVYEILTFDQLASRVAQALVRRRPPGLSAPVSTDRA